MFKCIRYWKLLISPLLRETDNSTVTSSLYNNRMSALPDCQGVQLSPNLWNLLQYYSAYSTFTIVPPRAFSTVKPLPIWWWYNETLILQTKTLRYTFDSSIFHLFETEDAAYVHWLIIHHYKMWNLIKKKKIPKIFILTSHLWVTDFSPTKVLSKPDLMGKRKCVFWLRSDIWVISSQENPKF